MEALSLPYYSQTYTPKFVLITTKVAFPSTSMVTDLPMVLGVAFGTVTVVDVGGF